MKAMCAMGPAAALSFMILMLLYNSCLAVASVMAKEIGRKDPAKYPALADIPTTLKLELPLYNEDFAVVVPEDHALAGRDDLGLADLDDLDLLLLDDGHCLHDQIVDLCRQADLNPTETTNSVTRASSLTTIMQLVAAGLGTTLVPVSAMRTECHRPGLATATFRDDVTAQREIGLVYRSSSSRAEEFRIFGELLTQAFRGAVEEPVGA